MKSHAAELGIRADQIMVGGESAGGGLCAAPCIKARDTGVVNAAFQMPLYPMLDDRDTETSRDNHGKVWNTRRNHFGWHCIYITVNIFPNHFINSVNSDLSMSLHLSLSPCGAK